MKTKDHYAALDALRGFSAISVVLYHLGHWLHSPWLATNSYLAVDFFFCLSGFVLPFAYEKRLATDMTPLQFWRIRLIRLMPLVALATILSALYAAARSAAHIKIVDYNELSLAAILGILNVPFLWASFDVGGPQIFPLNGPQFSLFLELIVNAVWSISSRSFGLLFSLIVCLVSIGGLAVVGIGGDETATFWSGFPRVGASFFLGVLIYRYQAKILPGASLRPVFFISTAMMIAAFYYPNKLPHVVELSWILLVSPLVVISAARTKLTERWQALALLAGALSYPIYVLHYPIFRWLNGIYQIGNLPQKPLIEYPLLLAGIIFASFVLFRYFDEPVRAALGRATASRLGTRSERPPNASDLPPRTEER